MRHPSAKFDDASVRRIRRRVASGVSIGEVAEALQVHWNTVYLIVKRQSYAAVE